MDGSIQFMEQGSTVTFRGPDPWRLIDHIHDDLKEHQLIAAEVTQLKKENGWFIVTVLGTKRLQSPIDSWLAVFS